MLLDCADWPELELAAAAGCIIPHARAGAAVTTIRAVEARNKVLMASSSFVLNYRGRVRAASTRPNSSQTE
jgi:hypothetical protein